MRIPKHLFLAVLLAFAPAMALACGEPDAAPCDNDAWSIYLPTGEGTPAPNVELVNFQHMNPQGMAETGIGRDELMRLHAAIKPLAAAAFSASATAFEVQVRYTLHADKPAEFDMQTTGGEVEHAMLTTFYESASALKDFRSTAPTIYVLFHYAISPHAAAGP